ncbi:hypothetical protein KCU78_g14403, partial [Aureobasidium melanogenum]
MPCLKVLPQDSGLFRYLVDYWVHYGSQNYVSDIDEFDDDQRIPRAFFNQALTKFAQENKEGYLVNSLSSKECLDIACNYHEHIDFEEWKHIYRLVFTDPCCSVINDYECDSNCDHPADMIKRGQACAYHKHSSPEEWKTCAGDDFEQSVDLIYLKGTTAIDPLPEKRFARFENPDSILCSPDNMIYTLSSCP